MAQTTPYSVKHYVEESNEASGLSLAREICQAFNISQSINYLKHLKCLCFIKLRSYLISVFLTSLHWKKPAKNKFFFTAVQNRKKCARVHKQYDIQSASFG